MPSQGFSSCMERGIARALGPEGACVVASGRASSDALLWIQHAGPVLPVVEASDECFERWLGWWSERIGALDAVDPGGESAPGGSPSASTSLSLHSLDSTVSHVVRLVNATLYDALRGAVSDVHLETTPKGMTVKYRIDGVLRPAKEVAGRELAEQAISRIKVMAELDIAEMRVPQDGRLQVSIDGRAIDVRVSIMPSVHGEDAVLRILDRQHLARELNDLTLESLGFDAATISALQSLARRPHGMILVTGPTGSGKTTTLYATINRTTSATEKVVTIEDPVEYQLAGVLQVPVSERKGLTFARGLRSILRHDPDKILVGEIRDAETAQIAVQAALTGHLVFTTVHANDVFDVIGRFRQFGIDGYSLMSALNGVLSQRLVRKVCSTCARLDEVSGAVHSTGCPACGGTGFRGRFAVGELTCLGSRLKSLIGEQASYEAVREAVNDQGFVGLRARALAAASAGITTQAEVDRVIAEA